jgi:predicted ribosome quality control (RQC) complex YloA/Tae2 family protein
MSLTEAELHDAANLLSGVLSDARFRDVREIRDQPDEWVFELRVPGENHYLLLSIDEEFARLSLARDRPKAPSTPAAFTMLLRSRLSGAILRELVAVKDDRIVRFCFDVIDEDDELRAYTLVAELMGRHGNLFLIDEANTVLGVANARKAAIRGAEPGATYMPPEPPPEHVTERREGWAERAESLALFDWLEEQTERVRTERKRKETFQSARSHLKREAKRLRRKIGHIEGDLEKAKQATESKRRADLLQMAYNQFEKGMTSVEVRDFHDPDQPLVTIETDPNTNLSKQIQDLYHEYKRMNDAIPRIEERLLDTMESLDRVQSLRDEFDDIETAEELDNRMRELEKHGDIRPDREQKKQRSKKRGGDTAGKSPYRTFFSSDGWPIFVGRNARGNDVLTMQVANGRDLWMHARDWSGAHVVIRREKKKSDIPHRTMREAALLAAHFSGGSNDTNVEIGYTEKKHVSKPPKAPPGAVYVAGMKTILVEPEDDIVDRLSKNRPEHDE